MKRGHPTHGMHSHPLYHTWWNMVRRCHHPAHPAYPRYGGREIWVWEPWRTDVRHFIEWIEANLGPRPDGMSLDRIDNDGWYEPGNLRWATPKMQTANGHHPPPPNRKLTPELLEECVERRRAGATWKELGREYGVNFTTVRTAVRKIHPQL